MKFTRYSPLDQINASNFNKLEPAWRFKTDALGTDERASPRAALSNRRLYNTGTSTYVTLEDLAGMVKNGEDFIGWRRCRRSRPPSGPR